ncbi:hypothetical protein [Roseicella aquatilis]|uniref:Uncharacterized protein n=1 Tax=Roseicella aquatilis TaxID=2527868 RepID=A0A4R4D8Q1_9PROT|nr:hypothetical protein [Roseicella aquatilis]TCZ56717.1 hypothetical protein EXY23_19220 [Roseicella aquatilis]
MNRFAAGLRAGLAYGLLAFLAGAVLGPVRELVLAPRIGGLPAALVEAAALGWLLWLAARRAARLLPPGPAPEARVGMAGLGVLLVLGLELALGAAFEASGLAAQRAPRGGAEALVGLLLLGWLAALPLRVRREG